MIRDGKGGRMGKIKKVCLLTNYNLYESKRHFTEKLAEAMRRHGLETLIIDVKEKDLSQSTIQSMRSFTPDFTCSFNSFDPVVQGTYLWDFLEIPHASFLVDPSFYSTALVNSPFSVITCVDRSDCAAVASSGFERVFFLPHAVEKELSSPENSERIYDVALLGTCYDYETLRARWRNELSAPLSKMLEDAADIVLTKDKVSLAEALVTAWNASKLDPVDVDFSLLYYYLDNYTRGKDRIELVRSIKHANVHIFGEMDVDNKIARNGWKHYVGTQKNVTLHGPVNFDKGLEIQKRSKIVLNSMPFFRDGTHERIFTGLACGALPLTSESIYLHEQFKENEDLLFYKAAKHAEAGAKVEEWLSNEKRRSEAVAKGRAKVMKHHTWDQRVETLLQSMPPMIEEINKRTKNTLIANKRK